jgi:hypothetical protein
LGGSSVTCAQNRLGRGQLGLNCPVNTYLEPQYAVFGIISAETESKKFCHQDAVDKINLKWNHKNCSTNLKPEDLKQRLID